MPSVTGPDEPSTWALPCLPAAGADMGLFTVPQMGAGVWIEYEGGDPGYPIWVGGYWSEREVPASRARGIARWRRPSRCRPRTATASSSATRRAKGILIQSASGAKISITDDGVITIDNGKGAIIELTERFGERERRRAHRRLAGRNRHAGPNSAPRRDRQLLARSGPGHAPVQLLAREGVRAGGGDAAGHLFDRRLPGHPLALRHRTVDRRAPPG